MYEDTQKRRPITAAQWLHARAVAEGAIPTRDRIAGMLDCNVTAVYERARKEDWTRLDFRRAEVCEAHRDFIELAGLDPEAAPEEETAPEGQDNDPPGEAEAADGEDPVELLRRGTSLLARRLEHGHGRGMGDILHPQCLVEGARQE